MPELPEVETTRRGLQPHVCGQRIARIVDARHVEGADKLLRLTLDLIAEIQGFPRHLSQHVGGFVITEGRLDELAPVENATMEDRTVIPWDKDDIDALGILKVDVLSLGMLTCLRKAFARVCSALGLIRLRKAGSRCSSRRLPSGRYCG